MYSDCSGAALGSSRGLCHPRSCLRQGEVGCKTSVPGQSKAQAAAISALGAARNATPAEAGLGSGATLLSPLAQQHWEMRRLLLPKEPGCQVPSSLHRGVSVVEASGCV